MAVVCAGEKGTCPNSPTVSVSFPDEVFHLCDACFKKKDLMSRRVTGKSLREIEKEEWAAVS